MKRLGRFIRCHCGKVAKRLFPKELKDTPLYYCGGCGDITDGRIHRVMGNAGSDKENARWDKLVKKYGVAELEKRGLIVSLPEKGA
jgi:hypothetical protein